jgi:hypothetical protein
MKNVHALQENIFITSDVEIKDARLHKGKWHLEGANILNKFPDYLTDLSECKLVIMTTDQDLIKDGVQAIDYEFLEWFVKNPSCEKVEVAEYLDSGFSYGYKIIIPKEEPFKHKVEVLSKEEILANRSNAYQFIDFDNQELFDYLHDELGVIALESQMHDIQNIVVNHQQKKLEEKLDKIVSKEPSKFLEESDKRMEAKAKLFRYSEEEVYHILAEHTAELFKGSKMTLTEWFDNIKKK